MKKIIIKFQSEEELTRSLCFDIQELAKTNIIFFADFRQGQILITKSNILINYLKENDYIKIHKKKINELEIFNPNEYEILKIIGGINEKIK